MPHKKLFIFLIVFGLGAKYLQEVYGIDFYVIENPTTEELSLGWILGISGLVAALVFIAKILGFCEGKEKSDDGWYHDEEYEEVYEEEEEEIYSQPVKVTWWNDYYD